MNRLNINEIRFALVEKVKKIGSIIVDNDYIDTHYAIKAENKIYDVNYRTKNDPHKILYNTLDSFSKYSNDYYIEYIFPFDDKFYLVYPEGENNKVILVFDQEQVNQTNFLNQFNTLFTKEEQT